MPFPEVLWQEKFDLLADQLARPVPEQLLGTLIDDPDVSAAVGNDGRVRRRIENSADDIGGQLNFVHGNVYQAVETPDYRQFKPRIRTLLRPERPYVSSPIRILGFA